jgi:hypothetical protein
MFVDFMANAERFFDFSKNTAIEAVKQLIDSRMGRDPEEIQPIVNSYPTDGTEASPKFEVVRLDGEQTTEQILQGKEAPIEGITASLQYNGKAWKLVKSYRVKDKGHPVAVKLNIGEMHWMDRTKEQSHLKTKALEHCISQARQAFEERAFEAWVTWNVKVAALLACGAKVKKPETRFSKARNLTLRDAVEGWGANYSGADDVLAKFERFIHVEDMNQFADLSATVKSKPDNGPDPDVELSELWRQAWQESTSEAGFYDSNPEKDFNVEPESIVEPESNVEPELPEPESPRTKVPRRRKRSASELESEKEQGFRFCECSWCTAVGSASSGVPLWVYISLCRMKPQDFVYPLEIPH